MSPILKNSQCALLDGGKSRFKLKQQSSKSMFLTTVAQISSSKNFKHWCRGKDLFSMLHVAIKGKEYESTGEAPPAYLCLRSHLPRTGGMIASLQGIFLLHPSWGQLSYCEGSLRLSSISAAIWCGIKKKKNSRLF